MAENQDGLVKPGFHCERKGHVLLVEIARPDKKNALTETMWIGLSEIFDAVATDAEIRTVILTGSGDSFCAGADIAEFDTARHGTRAAIYEVANSRAFAAIRDCSVPTIAAIDGICFGGGFGLAAACDLRIASADALFSIPAARLGLAYPVDAMADIVHAVGPQLARYLAFSAGRMDAETALSAGFLLEVTEQSPARDRALELAQSIAANAPLSVKASKASIRAVLSASPGDMEAAARLGALTFESDDYEEGRRAFKERRAAHFSGR